MDEYTSDLHGLVITHAGNGIIAGRTAGELESSLALAEVMVGTGIPPEGAALADLRSLTDLIAPAVAATSTVPCCDGEVIHMTVQIRSKDSGLDRGINISEIGVFVPDPRDAGKRLLFAYGVINPPKYLRAHSPNALDVLEFPMSIIVGPGGPVTALYDTDAWMTAKTVAEYCEIVMLPLFLDEAKKLIAAHNADIAAHPDIRRTSDNHEGRISALEDISVKTSPRNQPP